MQKIAEEREVRKTGLNERLRELRVKRILGENREKMSIVAAH